MSENARCCYCSRLPERRLGHGCRVQRCPLCKSEVGVAGSGDAFRIATGPAPSRHRLVGALAVCSLLGASLMAAGYVAWHQQSTPTIVAAPPEPVRELPTPPRLEVVAVAAPVIRGESKRRGLAYPMVRAKPKSQLVRGAAKADGADKYSVASRFAEVKFFARPPRTLAKQVGEPAFGPEWLDPATRSKEAEALARVPEVRFESVTTKDEMMKSFRRVADQHKKGSDAFIDALVKERSDLAGLPFLKGEACKVPTKAQQGLAATAGALRENLGVQHFIFAGSFAPRDLPPDTARLVVANSIAGFSPGGSSGRGSASLSGFSGTKRGPAEFLPAMMQVLAAEPAGYRVGLAAHLEDLPTDNEATITSLVRLALFDPEPSVREAAVKALRRESPDKVGPRLVQGFWHPWRHVAEHAADAIVALELVESLPKVVDFLGEPDPAAPIERTEGGKKVQVLREVVKINHHRNCMLCHAPTGAEDDDILRSGLAARVPSEDEELPPSSSRLYYDVRRGNIAVVRANETYLRQDFTVLEAVDNSGKWPRMQRFDFIVRTRTLLPGEAQLRQTAQVAGETPSPHHRAALYALSRLMWTYLGTKPDDWRQDVARRVREVQTARR
jgi:hypothetical protein